MASQLIEPTSSESPIPTPLLAVAKPATSEIIPPLYVYDQSGNHVFSAGLSAHSIANEVFGKAEAEAYWGEVVDGRFYLIPWLDKCSQSSMLGSTLDFRAPEGGLLFVQFVAPGCRRCDELSNAISSTIASNPDGRFRWVQVSVPKRIGSIEGR